VREGLGRPRIGAEREPWGSLLIEPPAMRRASHALGIEKLTDNERRLFAKKTGLARLDCR
jgi:hypothetical protein